jgi:hypothetical protein
MASGMQTVIYPVKDLESAKTSMKRVACWVCTGLVGGHGHCLQRGVTSS